jgi:hypothetical protein
MTILAFLIAIAFVAAVILIARIKPSDPDSTNTGAVEGNDRDFGRPYDSSDFF